MATTLDKSQAGDLLQALVDRFIGLESLLRCTSEEISFLLECQEKHGIEYKFDEETGELLTVRQNETYLAKYDLPDLEIFNEEYCQWCKESVPRLAEYLNKLYAERHVLDTTLGEMPSKIISLLSNVRGQNWRPLVRNDLILPLGRWPRLPSRESWRGGITYPRHTSLPNRIDQLLEYAAETDPTEYWQQLCQQMDSLIDNVVAVAPEIGADIHTEVSPPPDSKVSIDSRALAYLIENQAATHAIVAKAIGCNEKSLRVDRCPNYFATRARIRLPERCIRGTMDTDGSTEAWIEE